MDTHAIHFHLFDVQLVNRVDWAGVVKPPDPNELGWKDTVRMNPLEDAIVALRPVAPIVPFQIHNSVRPLDPTMPLGSTFQSIDPITNAAVTVVNQMTNFGWEYVWHCHLLGHEEMDMMRPMVFHVTTAPPAAPSNLVATAAGPLQVNLIWQDNSNNEGGFRIERAPASGAFAPVATVLANVTAYADHTVSQAGAYSYRIFAVNSGGDSPPSNTATVTTGSPPAAPTNLTATASPPGTNPATVTLAWVDNAAAEAGFTIQRARNINFTQQATSFAVGANVTLYTDTTVQTNTTYYYRVRATNAAGASAWSNNARADTPAQAPTAPAAPTNLRATVIRSTYVILSWTDNSTNETGFYLERSDNGGATWTRVGQTVANSTTFRNTSLTTGTTHSYRVQAYNGGGVSTFSNVLTVATP